MKALVIAAVLFLTGCATPYQSKGFTGGFDETQLSPEVYRVSFQGNAYVAAETVADYVMLRCAELTVESGFQYFVVVDTKDTSRSGAYTTPKSSQTTANATAYGNAYSTNVQGTATTTTYGGQTYFFAFPSETNTILMLHEKPQEGFAYDAQFLVRSLRQKYKIPG